MPTGDFDPNLPVFAALGGPLAGLLAGLLAHCTVFLVDGDTSHSTRGLLLELL